MKSRINVDFLLFTYISSAQFFFHISLSFLHLFLFVPEVLSLIIFAPSCLLLSYLSHTFSFSLFRCSSVSLLFVFPCFIILSLISVSLAQFRLFFFNLSHFSLSPSLRFFVLPSHLVSLCLYPVSVFLNGRTGVVATG